jgi:hypothetical protein
MRGQKSGLALKGPDLGALGLRILVLWAGLCAVWNAYGAMQLSTGGRALGPTATFAGAGFAILLAIILIVASNRWPRVCRALAVAAGALAALTVFNSFILDKTLWPSEFWRWAGIVLNAFGVVGAAITALSSGRGAQS